MGSKILWSVLSPRGYPSPGWYCLPADPPQEYSVYQRWINEVAELVHNTFPWDRTPEFESGFAKFLDKFQEEGGQIGYTWSTKERTWYAELRHSVEEIAVYAEALQAEEEVRMALLDSGN